MESSRRLIIMLVMGVVVIFGVIAIRSFMGTPEPAAPEEQPIRIVVATRDIAQGSVVQASQDFEWKEIGKDELQETYLREGQFQVETLNGAIVRRQLRAGEAVTQSALTRAGAGGFLSAVLEPGMRAVSVAVNPTSGNAGFISPGDRVDLIVTHRIHAHGSTNSLEGAVVSETFVRNVRVIAVDQMLENSDNRAVLAKTITVEVTPRQAEQIAVASDLGKISMVLRSLANGEVKAPPESAAADTAEPKATAADAADNNAPALTDLYGNITPAPDHRSYTRDSDVSGALDTGGLSSTIRVIRGDQVENISLQ